MGSDLTRADFCHVRSISQRLLQSILLLSLAASTGIGQTGFLENGQARPRGTDTGAFIETPKRGIIDLSGSWTLLSDGVPAGSVGVPHSFQFEGGITLERRFPLTAEELDSSQFQIVLLGVTYAAEISVNGEFLASHSGGGTPIVQPIPSRFLQIGPENLIRISVHNRLDPRSTLPLRGGVWNGKNYGGITRDVFLLRTPLLYVRDASYTTHVDESTGRGGVKGRIFIDGPDPAGGNVGGVPPGTLSCVVELVEKISGAVASTSAPIPLRRAADGWEPLDVSCSIDAPRLWSVETPDLYIARCAIVSQAGKISTVVDQHETVIGIRSLELRNADFVLSGKRIVLRGVTWYEDHPRWGSALTYEQMEKDVVLIKSLGANLIRFAEKPPHPYMLNLCDRYGLLALVELPLRAPGGVLEEEQYLEMVTAAVREMVTRDRNHPALLAWGIGDQFDAGAPAARPVIQALARQVRDLDPRPVYYALRSTQADLCSDLVDFVGMNSVARDLKSFRNELEEWRGNHQGAPLVVTRLGTEVQHENRNGYTDPLSQQAQARFYLQRLDAARSFDVDGVCVWSFNDWRGERPALTVHSGEPTLHATGLVSENREKRIAYDAVRALFQNEKFPALPAGSVSASAPIIYVLSGFVLLVGLAYLYSVNRRFRESLQRSFLNPYNFYADVRDQHGIPVHHTLLLALMVSGAAGLIYSSLLLHYRDDLFVDELLSLLLISDAVKEGLVTLVWRPLRFILAGGVLLSAGMACIALLVLGLRLISRLRVSVYQAFTTTVWSASPFIVLIPVGMILYRLMESPAYVAPAIVLMIILHLWVYLRLLRGLAIVLDLRPALVFGAGIAAVCVVGGGAFAYFDLVHSAPMYIAFWYHTLVSGG